MSIIIGTWLHEDDIIAAEGVLRLDNRITNETEEYAVFASNDGVWEQVSDWQGYESAMEELQSLIFLYADAEPILENDFLVIDSLSQLFWQAVVVEDFLR